MDPGIAAGVSDYFVGHVLGVVLDGRIIESSSDQSLGGEDSVFRIGDGLSLGSGANKSFTFVGESNHGRSGSDTLRVLDDFGSTSLHDGDAGVSGSEIDTNDNSSFLGRESWDQSVFKNSSHHFSV